ncbi:MAG: hypothetical protein AAGG75_08960 [Bacteroidota bacterium]
MTLDVRKYNLIKKITGLDNEVLISKLETLLQELSEDNSSLLALAKPIKDTLNIEELAKEQGFSPTTQEELDDIIAEANIQEPIEDLLAMLK